MVPFFFFLPNISVFMKVAFHVIFVNAAVESWFKNLTAFTLFFKK